MCNKTQIGDKEWGVKLFKDAMLCDATIVGRDEDKKGQAWKDVKESAMKDNYDEQEAFKDYTDRDWQLLLWLRRAQNE